MALSAKTKAILCIVVAGGLLITSDGMGKYLAADYPVGEIIFMRCLFMVPVAVLVSTLLREPLHWPRAMVLHGVRGALMLASNMLFLIALIYLPLVEAVSLTFVAPLVITALSGPLLGERVGWGKWGAVVLGFSGVLFLLRPEAGGILHWAAALALGAAVCGALKDIMIVPISRRDTSVTTLCTAAVIVGVCSLATVPGWLWPAWDDFVLMAAGGIVIGFTHYFTNEAFRLADASVLAPFLPVQLVWSLLIGFAVWGELPSLWDGVGAALIAAGVIIVMRISPTPVRSDGA